MPDGTFASPRAPRRWRRGFWSLIATQFQGAFNENALKFLIIYLVLALVKDKAQRDRLEFLVGALFAAPFILFSLSGGYLADRFSKRNVTIWTKVFEIGVMLLAVLALAGPNFPLALAGIFLVCTQGALFGPSKYGLLPELLPAEKLSWGNGVLELGTFLGIIAGSLCGALLADAFAGHQVYSGALLFAFAMVGLVFSFGISRVPAADPAKRFRLTSIVDEVDSRRSRPVAGGAWEYLLFLRGGAAAIQHFSVRPGCSASGLHARRI